MSFSAGGVGWGAVIAAWGQAGYHSLVVMNCIHVTLILYILLLLPLLFLLNCLYFNPQVFTFSHSPPHPTVGEREVSEPFSGA